MMGRVQLCCSRIWWAPQQESLVGMLVSCCWCAGSWKRDENICAALHTSTTEISLFETCDPWPSEDQSAYLPLHCFQSCSNTLDQLYCVLYVPDRHDRYGTRMPWCLSACMYAYTYVTNNYMTSHLAWDTAHCTCLYYNVAHVIWTCLSWIHAFATWTCSVCIRELVDSLCWYGANTSIGLYKQNSPNAEVLGP